MTIGEAVFRAKKCLEAHQVPDYGIDALLLLQYVSRISRAEYFAHQDAEYPDAERYLELVSLRAKRIPLQQITGETYFCALRFLVTEDVLCPRQETELLVEEALKRIPPGGRFLDLCTGSGCIAVSLLCLGNNLSGCGCDLSEDALRIASSNARLHHVTAHLELRQGDLYDALSGETGSAACPSGLVDAPMRRNIDAPAEGWDGHLQGNLDGPAEGCDEPLRRNIDAPADEYDMIVSNPPYIASDKIAGLMEEVRDHEPVMALDGGADGLVFYRRILEGADKYLKRGGWLLVEIGYDQAGAVRSMFGDYRYESVRVIKDLAGLDRIVLGQRGNLCV